MSGEHTGNDISPTRLEAFSDGVIAIIITIMVLELRPPHGTTPAGLLALWPVFVSYAISFFYVAIYWINHHHLVRHLKKVDTKILWANMLLLFCVSFIPFSTAYLGENQMAAFSTALYLATLLLSATAFYVLTRSMKGYFNEKPELKKFRQSAERKNLMAMGLYAVGIAGAFWAPWAGLAMAFVVAGFYFLPDTWIKEGA